MAYILVVNPTVLSAAGLPFGVGAFATAATAVLGSGLVGAFGNLPFGLAPGMGLNAYFAYGVCVAKGIKFGSALAVVFVMGVLFAVLAAAGACAFLQRIIPANLKHAITVAIGIFQAFIGFRMINLVVADRHTLVALGDVTSAEVLCGVSTLFLIGALVVHRVPGAMLVGIGISSCASWALGLQRLPDQLVQVPAVKFYWSDFQWAELVSEWETLVPVLVALLFVCIFDTAGVQFGAGMQAGLLDADGVLPGTRAAFLASAVATTVGALLGTSPTIIHNETCAGIADGGRTGLTAIVVALLFSLSVFFVPVFAAVPLTATAPALIIVGAFMTGPAGAMDWDSFHASLPAFITITVTPLTYSIANGVLSGLVTHLALEVLTRPLELLTTMASLILPARAAQPAAAAREPLNGNGKNGNGHHNGTWDDGKDGNGRAGATRLKDDSAVASPHAMVREPMPQRINSFGGLSALGGKASPIGSLQSSPYGSPAPPDLGKYQPPAKYPDPRV